MQTELSPDIIKQFAQKGRESLYFLAKAILGFDKFNTEIHKPMCDLLQDYEKNNRVALILPRGWYKSTMATIAYPIWRAINNPESRGLIVQNTYTNACGKLGAVKQIFEMNDLFRLCYPEILPTRDCTWAKDAATVHRKGAYPEATWEAAGTGTQKTGQHYDYIIEDDTVSPDKDNLTGAMMQPTQAEIEKAIGWFRLATPLLIEPVDSQRIVVGTRWAENDLLGFIIDHHDEYHILTRAVRETDGKPDPDGEVQWPKRFNAAVLKSVETDLGPYMFAALYLNSPTDATNQIFQRAWINYYQTLPPNLVYCTAVDLASASKEESSDPDYNVVLTVGINPNNGHIYVVHYTRERMSPSAVISTIFDHNRAYKPVKVIIEGIGYQRTLKHWLEQRQRKIGEMFYIDVITGHTASKVDRIRGLQPYFASNRVFFRTGMDVLERELLAFPKAAHDDLPDTLAMLLPFFSESTRLGSEDKAQRLGRDQHSADVILKELQARVTQAGSYPYNMGIMAHSLNPYRTDYVTVDGNPYAY